MERVRVICKWILYFVVFVLVFSFQSAYANRFQLFGAKPDFLPFLVVCLAFLEGAKPGAVMGLVAGILCGAVTNLGALYTLLYFAAGYAVGTLSAARMRTNFFTVTIFALLLDILCVLSRTLAAYILHFNTDPLARLAEYGGYAIFTIAAALPLYPLFRAIHRLSEPAVRRDRRMRYRL